MSVVFSIGCVLCWVITWSHWTCLTQVNCIFKLIVRVIKTVTSSCQSYFTLIVFFYAGHFFMLVVLSRQSAMSLFWLCLQVDHSFSSWLCSHITVTPFSRVHCTLMLIMPSTPLHLIKPIIARSKQSALLAPSRLHDGGRHKITTELPPSTWCYLIN